MSNSNKLNSSSSSNTAYSIGFLLNHPGEEVSPQQIPYTTASIQYGNYSNYNTTTTGMYDNNLKKIDSDVLHSDSMTRSSSGGSNSSNSDFNQYHNTNTTGSSNSMNIGDPSSSSSSGFSSRSSSPQEEQSVSLNQVPPTQQQLNFSSDRNGMNLQSFPPLPSMELYNHFSRTSSSSNTVVGSSSSNFSSRLPTRSITGIPTTAAMVTTTTNSTPQQHATTRSRKRNSAAPRVRQCSVAGCTYQARSKGLCKGHGGGKRCRIPGCTRGSQGGSGLCISHGGGYPCKSPGCTTAVQSHGYCKAHGGGGRCAVPSCTKGIQIRGYCRKHGRQLLDMRRRRDSNEHNNM